ncbi:MAG: hypothetical protein ACXVY6_13555 [Gaiellaceae bacterium]
MHLDATTITPTLPGHWNLSGPFSTMTHTGMRFVSEGDVVFEGDVWLGAFADAFEEIKD